MTKKKLSKRARVKESTGINVEAAKKREAKLEERIDVLEQKYIKTRDAIAYICEHVGIKVNWLKIQPKKKIKK